MRRRKKSVSVVKRLIISFKNLTSSSIIFFVLSVAFVGLVIFRFVAIQSMDTSSDECYIYQFDKDIYGEFYIENNQTIVKSSKNITIVDEVMPKKGKKVLSPYSFITLNLDETTDKKAVYQLLPDKKEYSNTFFTRSKWFEVIGGAYQSKDGDSLIRMNASDTPVLMILNSNPNKNLYKAESLRVVALQSGYYYQSSENEKIEMIPYLGSLKSIRQEGVWNSLEATEIDNIGYISNGKERIKIVLGTKNKSVLVSSKPKRYALAKARTLNISIVNKDIPSSTLKLVSHRGLSEKKLSYDYVRIAHLLITYNIGNASSTIKEQIEDSNFLKKELMDIAENLEENLDQEYFRKYNKAKESLTKIESKKLNQELIRYVMEGNYYRTKKTLLMGADINVLGVGSQDLLSLTLSQQKAYLSVPQVLKFVDNRLLIRGNSKAFKAMDYGLSDKYFPVAVPVLDKPLIPKKGQLNVHKLNEFLDVTKMNGLFVSDTNAEVFYSRTPNSFVQKALINYKKAPPLFLYNQNIRGQFVAPPIGIKDKFYYKIKTKKNRKLWVSFNGKIRVNGKKISSRYNEITPFYKQYSINSGKSGEVILEVNMIDRPLACGVVFSSTQKIDSLEYSYGWRNFKPFEIVHQGGRYLYRLQIDASKPFKKYSLKIKSKKVCTIKHLGENRAYTIRRRARVVNYTPSLSCLAKERQKEFLSLYDKENILEIVPKDYQENGWMPKEQASKMVEEIDDDASKEAILSKPLLPIYGDGRRFGLTSKGVKVDELTLDAPFSQKVAQIFEKVIQPLKLKHHLKERKKYNTILEGAVVVLRDNGKDDLSVVSMFSYPYPKKLDITNEKRYNKEIFRYMLIDEFNNAQSSIRNRALDMRIRPGSTFKIVTAITGFKEGVIKVLDSKFRRHIEGRQDINGSQFRNNTKVGIKLKNFSFSNGFTERTEGATFKNSFKYSYNVYFGYLSLLLNHKLDNGFKKELYPISNDKAQREKEFPLLAVANQLQFNKPIYLSKEKKIFAYPSLFPDNFVLAKEVADAGIGQFEVAVTPMQMAIVANSVRSKKVVVPKIIKDEKSQILDSNFISSSTQNEIESAMGLVVNNKEGTAKCAFYPQKFFNEARAKNKRIKNKKHRVKVPCVKYRQQFSRVNSKDFGLNNVKVYGKTGTAEKGKGKLYDGWFIAYTKSNKGDIVVATVVRNSGTGGTYSATITKQVIEAWYNRDKK